MEQWTVKTNGATLAGESAGAGQAVVFLHAGVADRRMWRAQMAARQDTYYVAAYDRRGFGETVTEDVPFRRGDDLGAVLDALGMQTAVLAGCSMGGLLALEFTLAHPERVDGLVLIAAAVTGAPWPEQEPPLTAARETALEAAEAAGDLATVNDLEAVLWLDGPESAAGRVGGAARVLFLDMNRIALAHPPLNGQGKETAVFERLGEISVPALVLWGDLDYAGVELQSRLLVEAIPAAQGMVIPGTAHLPPLEQPEVVNRLLREFLAEL
jgi:pimeloyl-ACP methyl ester carboxylesterase